MSTSSQHQSLLTQLNHDLEAAAGKLPLTKKPEDIVPGEGNAAAKIMLIGEAPGHLEAVQRRPFVGRSGQLLRKTLTEVGLTPAEVYISNIVKARPPENRDPTPAEILAYKPFLDREIEILDPTLIITLGRFSMYKFLADVKVSMVHGRLHKVDWQGNNHYILPMYHPAAALRATRVKDMFIADFAKVKKIADWLEEKSRVNKDDQDLQAQVEAALLS